MTAKEMAQKMVGDGKSPNKYFVTCAPWYMPIGSEDMVQIPGFNENWGAIGVFDDKEEAIEYYREIELDFRTGIGQVMVEDRMVGVLCERFLRETSRFVEDEIPEMPY
jgi:hypothetical protein